MDQKYNLQNIKEGKGPRDKLLETGPDSLTDAELLATVFITGTRNENVLELSSRVIREYGSRSISHVREPSKLQELLGLGQSKSCQLVALFELGRRYFLETSNLMPTIKGPEDVQKVLEGMKNARKEEVRTLYLNSRQKVIREELTSLGSENMNIISPKEILHPAVELMAKGIIIAHNHPSGSADPSNEDIIFTQRMVESCKILGIEFVDHVIIAKHDFVSLLEEGFI